jgi:hypothetical protein
MMKIEIRTGDEYRKCGWVKDGMVINKKTGKKQTRKMRNGNTWG